MQLLKHMADFSTASLPPQTRLLTSKACFTQQSPQDPTPPHTTTHTHTHTKHIFSPVIKLSTVMVRSVATGQIHTPHAHTHTGTHARTHTHILWAHGRLSGVYSILEH